MILLLPLVEKASSQPPLTMLFLHGHPRIWWVLQSYEKLASLVIAIVNPAHLQAGIQLHLPRSTAISIASETALAPSELCKPLRPILDGEEELLIADPLTPYDLEQMKQAIGKFRLSTTIGNIDDTTWWKQGSLFWKALENHPQATTFLQLLPPDAYTTYVGKRQFEDEDIGMWQSQWE